MTVKKSLQELSRALNGDNKTEVIPIFNVLTILKNNRRVELKPNVQVGRSRSTLSNPR